GHVHVWRAALQPTTLEGHLSAWLDVGLPAAANQLLGAAHLRLPPRGLAARVDDIEHENRVRVNQLGLDDGAGDLHDIFDIASRIAVMCPSSVRNSKSTCSHAGREN